MAKKTKKTKQAARIPTYKDAEGLYLVVDEREYSVKIGWYVPEDYDVGLYLYNGIPKDGDASETAVANQVVISFCKEHKLPLPSKGGDFEFDSITMARAALRAVNLALHAWRDKRPLPEWAEKAAAAGWLPPKGWRP